MDERTLLLEEPLLYTRTISSTFMQTPEHPQSSTALENTSTDRLIRPLSHCVSLGMLRVLPTSTPGAPGMVCGRIGDDSRALSTTTNHARSARTPTLASTPKRKRWPERPSLRSSKHKPFEHITRGCGRPSARRHLLRGDRPSSGPPRLALRRARRCSLGCTRTRPP